MKGTDSARHRFPVGLGSEWSVPLSARFEGLKWGSICCFHGHLFLQGVGSFSALYSICLCLSVSLSFTIPFSLSPCPKTPMYTVIHTLCLFLFIHCPPWPLYIFLFTHCLPCTLYVLSFTHCLPCTLYIFLFIHCLSCTLYTPPFAYYCCSTLEAAILLYSILLYSLPLVGPHSWVFTAQCCMEFRGWHYVISPLVCLSYENTRLI